MFEIMNSRWRFQNGEKICGCRSNPEFFCERNVSFEDLRFLSLSEILFLSNLHSYLYQFKKNGVSDF